MKNIRAYSCIRDGSYRQSSKPGAAVFLLNEAHAGHTLRTFMRGQGGNAVLEPMSSAEASRLLGGESESASEKPVA